MLTEESRSPGFELGPQSSVTHYNYSSRFTSSKSGVLVASDVAARGLDLPAVEHIIHYQVPRNSEVGVG